MMIMDSNENKSMNMKKNSIKFYPILSLFWLLLFFTTLQQTNCLESSNQHSLLNQSSQVQIEYIDNEIQNQKYSKPTVAPSFNKNLQYPPVYIPSTSTTTTIRPKVIFADGSSHSRQTAFQPINQSSVIYFTEKDKRQKSSSVIYENLAPKFENSKVVFDDDDEDDNGELREELLPGVEIDNQDDENDDENENKEHRPIVFVIKNPSSPDGVKPNKLYLNKNGNAEIIDIGQNQQQLLINTVVDLNRRLAKLRKKNLQLKKIKNSDNNNNKSRKKIIRRLSNDKNNKGRRRKVVIKKKKLIRARPQQQPQPIMLISEDGPSVDHPNTQRFIIENNHDDDEDSDSMDSNHEEDKLIPLNSSNSKIKKNERLLEYFRKKQQQQQSAPPPIPPPPPEIVNQPQVVNVQYSSGPEGDNSKIPAEYQPWQPLAPIAQMPLMANVYWRKIVFPTVPILPAVLAKDKDIGGGVATSQSTSSTSSIDSAATLDQGRLHRTNLATITEPSSSSSFAKIEGNNSIIDNKNGSGKTRKKYIIYYVRNNNQQNNNPIIINGTDSNETSQLNDQVDWNSDDDEEEDSDGDEQQPELGSKQSEQPESNGSKTVIRKDPTSAVNLKQEKMLKSLLKLIQKQNLNNNNRKNSMVTYEENDQLDNNEEDDADNEELTLQTQNPYNNGDKQKWIFPDASKPNQLLKIVKQAPKSPNVQHRLQKIQSAKSNQPIKLIIRRNRKIIRHPKMAPPPPPPPSVIHRTRPRSYARRYRHLTPPPTDNYRPRIRKRIRTVRIIKV